MEVTVPVPGTVTFALLGATEREKKKKKTDVGRYPLAWFGLGGWFGLVSSVALVARQALSPLLEGPFFFS
jgi:hypothetical protein